ncbi:Bacillosamine/Legionaminic acid biosynthesis aminotransferase PglE [Acidisarcina polymorpha]|uniref:Bacillosamine/Legionaminic acid biosynthesis aminotransferase PglE n=1 Tax=Acidisarcina polymorpha TaxID=2211140 RepID=A0A2Z5FTM8_9BACT|nr:DegT/DnrJ/EryC1/StrS family aminotransferase [Acidisarcina polymorpha]AXC09857.1 Bacillosamine/Legionaminic acid biosynthesis aminotransferase PglE [Acidisarcina polymorpha]
MEMRIPLSSPDIDEDDIAGVVSVLRSSRLSLGPMLGSFEQAVAEYLGITHAVAVSSGTAGLHLALLALGVGTGDEVIVPSFTFIAAANAIRYVGAQPVFVDIDASTLNLDPERVESSITARTRALLIVHTFGVPAEMDSLMQLAKRHGLLVIEDACEAIGAEYKGRRLGTFGDAGTFAFYPNKQITTGEGGMVVARDGDVAASIRSLRNQGRRKGDSWFEHSDLGYNYRISEMNCALGLSQLKRIDKILERRAAVAEEYDVLLRGSSELTLPPLSLPDRIISWFVYVVRLNARFSAAQRDVIRNSLVANGIGCGRYFAPIHLQPSYRSILLEKLHLPVTESEAERTLALPFFNHLTKAQVMEVAENLLGALHP